MVSEPQPCSGIQMGESRDTDFGQDQGRSKFDVGRVRPMIQKLGETDFGLADTLEGSSSIDARQMINNRLGLGGDKNQNNYITPKIGTTGDSKL